MALVSIQKQEDKLILSHIYSPESGFLEVIVQGMQRTLGEKYPYNWKGLDAHDSSVNVRFIKESLFAQ